MTAPINVSRDDLSTTSPLIVDAFAVVKIKMQQQQISSFCH
jgi:hypothetical protein